MVNEKIPKEYVVKIRRGDTEREFVTYSGLLELAHKKGLKRIYTEITQIPTKENNYYAVVRASVELENGIFADVGDASPESVDSHLVPHILRMACTRAKARALRDALGIGTPAVEELETESESERGSKVEHNATPLQQDYIKALTELDCYNAAHNKELLLNFLKEHKIDSIDKLTIPQADTLIKKMDRTKRRSNIAG